MKMKSLLKKSCSVCKLQTVRITATLPQGEPIVSAVVSAERLKQAAAGQEGMVRLNVYGRDQAVELSSAGKYALVMPVMDVQEW